MGLDAALVIVHITRSLNGHANMDFPLSIRDDILTEKYFLSGAWHNRQRAQRPRAALRRLPGRCRNAAAAARFGDAELQIAACVISFQISSAKASLPGIHQMARLAAHGDAGQ